MKPTDLYLTENSRRLNESKQILKQIKQIEQKSLIIEQEISDLKFERYLKKLRLGGELDKDQMAKCIFNACLCGDLSSLSLCLERLGTEAKSILQSKRSVRMSDHKLFNLCPLSIAIYNHHAEICHYLVLQQNVKITFDILWDASDSNNPEIFLFLMKNSKIDNSDVDERFRLARLLQYILPTATAKMIKAVIKAGADPFQPVISTSAVPGSCLGTAIIYGNVEAFKIFLELKPNINLCSETIPLCVTGYYYQEHKGTPLLLAASLNKWEFARMLLEHKETPVDVNAHHPDLLAPIHYFAHYDLENKSDKSDITHSDNLEAILTLLEYNASIDIEGRKDKKYLNAREIIRKTILLLEDRQKLVQKLLEIGIFGKSTGFVEGVKLIAEYAVTHSSEPAPSLENSGTRKKEETSQTPSCLIA
jgi:hypothetical protein